MNKRFAVLFLVACWGTAWSQPPGWKIVGMLKTKSAKEIPSSTWSIGGETLDRNYTDYQSYKKYLAPLGAKRIRLQGGWARCEKVKGQYNFGWLDSIIPDAASRGVYPWVQLSYGNPIYEGGGEAKLMGHIPTSDEALKAWDAWVTAMIKRYKAYVPDWEIWNEPDGNKEHTGRELGALYVRTAKIVRSLQPNARLIALGMASVTRLDFVKDFMDYLKENNSLQYINIFTYHGYAYNPDDSYPKIEDLRQLVWRYNPDIVFMQGENGAPSTPKAATIGALRDQDWSEWTQAKWDLRRMMGDHGRGIATNLFTISDIHYEPGDHMVGINSKGLLKTNPDKTIDRPKMAYKAAQHVFTLFDDQWVPAATQLPATDGENIAAFTYHHKTKGGTLVTIWNNKARPAEDFSPQKTRITVEGNFIKPVWVDLISGKVYAVPETQYKKAGKETVFTDLPVSDYPAVITEQSFLSLNKYSLP